ncbi:hypothetical protein [Carbonactinospora thermoautotrophica]|nr:hypothetical protein [Carbonactinospora thermoautotrophica]
MSAQAVRTPPAPARPRALAALPVVAGIAYAASWLVGLVLSPSSTDLHSPGAQVLAGYAGHEAVATNQRLLTAGAAGVLLALVALALAGRARLAGASRPAWWVTVAGLGAAALSLAQCLLGVYLTRWVVPDRRADVAGVLFEAINRLDGVKMFLLAALALAGTALAWRARVLPRWLGYAGVALAAALLVSGFGYLLLIGAAAQAAYLSLPLLILWVAGTGIALSRSER